MTDDLTPADGPTPDDRPPAPSPRVRRTRGWLRGAVWSFMALLLLVAVLAGGAWIWMGSGQSLAQTLAQAARHMPEGMTLESEGVSGSLRKGGHIGRLRWQSRTLSVEVRDATLGWSLPALLQRKVQVGEVSIAQVDIAPIGPRPVDDTPVEPLQQLALPIDIELPFKVDLLRWAGPPELVATGLAGSYRYQGGEHRLKVDGVDLADGHYVADVKLQGAAPMALDAHIDARVRAPMGDERSLDVLAAATAKGTLAGAQARLDVQANVAPVEQAPDQPMRADARAQVAPWQKQPLVEADIVLAHFDLARLLPQAPVTDLSGEVHLGPDAAAGPQGWQGSVDLRNGQPGPWDKARLPLDQLQAQVRYDGQQWLLPQVVLRRGKGRIDASGNWRPGTDPWEANLSVDQLAPGDLHTQLAGAPIDGNVKVQQASGGRIDFSADLRAKGGAGAKARKDDLMAGLQLRRLVAQGLWQDEVLTLGQLRAEAAGVLLEGKGRATPKAQSGDGQLTLRLPGLQADVKADMAPTKGQGELKAQLDDTAALQRWIESLPGLSKAFGGLALQGNARLDASWTGGWQTLQQRLSAPDKPAEPRGAEPTLRAHLEVPRLGTRGSAPPAADAWEVRDLRADLSGSLADAKLSLTGDANAGPRRLSLSLQGGGGVRGAGQWQASLATLQARLQPDSRLKDRPWIVQLQQSLSATVRSQKDSLQVDVEGSRAQVTGPLPGSVRLSWEATRLASKGPTGRRALRIQSTGQLRGLPLGWARALGSGSLQELGVGGDVVFDGNWDIDAGDRLRAKVQVSRASGDIRVQAGEAAMVRRVHSTGTGTPSEIETDVANSGPGDTGSIPAGLRKAQLDIEAEGEQLRASLVWDSERAGVIKAEASTRLARGADGWAWPADAPLAGQVDASMPKLGVWSILAPPGWRVGGTLEAAMTLSGRRDDPRWTGTLSGDDLSLRAAVEGLDLRGGKLRARLEGQRLVLEEFSLRGGPGSTVRIPGRSGNLSTGREQEAADGGSLRLSGSAGWGAAAGGGSSSGITMDMRGEIQHLRVLVRADRQVTLSGDMQAGLAQGKLTLRSKLTTDRGVIILPASTAPQLGGDVKIHSAARDKAAAEAAAREADRDERKEKAAIRQAQTAKAPDILIVLDLGKDFAVQGHGITTRLEGELNIRADSLAGLPSVTGEVRTVAGIYRAYGQQLDVETGLARFNGRADNPQLDIVALRPNIDQRAGVRVTGTASSPRVNLYSEPPLPDAETLSWIMLGRASASNGGEAVLMQQAALALLGTLGAGGAGSGGIAQNLGLDEIGFKGPGENGEVAESSVTLGKRLSKDFYVTYERSLASTMGTLYLFYDLTQRLTLRGEAGQQYGADLIYTIKYD
ncbi:translocation/assembly module TamB domain-containing protein [Variovorax sp.]|uniref:translocation/assembly module TamB domain-containing protein n=1 Tax=Variovorax sp. TaxID=1871043 RepID=UPI002D5B7BF3|nr:translocation/assembly module TamB domain-containing protein [Variovorax sp.]HYP83363.1 translocation/assembly module TamB domain-containing protein [Variovorax sp.]